MNRLYTWIIALHIFIGIGATAGGIAALTKPESPMGMPVEMLKASPFDNYLIPGLFLFLVLGLPNIGVSVWIKKRFPAYGLLSTALGGILVLWILIQCYFLQAVGALHIIFFILGIIQGFWGLILLYRNNDFPMNIVKRYLKISRK